MRIDREIQYNAMGSHLGLVLANDFVIYFEKNWLQNCPFDFKPFYHGWYADDIFVLFLSLEHLEVFRNVLNGWPANTTFTIKNETQNRMFFFDVQSIRGNIYPFCLP